MIGARAAIWKFIQEQSEVGCFTFVFDFDLAFSIVLEVHDSAILELPLGAAYTAVLSLHAELLHHNEPILVPFGGILIFVVECLVLSGTDGIFAGLVEHAVEVASVAATVLLVAALPAVIFVGTVCVASANAAATG